MSEKHLRTKLELAVTPETRRKLRAQIRKREEQSTVKVGKGLSPLLSIARPNDGELKFRFAEKVLPSWFMQLADRLGWAVFDNDQRGTGAIRYGGRDVSIVKPQRSLMPERETHEPATRVNKRVYSLADWA